MAQQKSYKGDTGVVGSPDDVMGYIRSGQNRVNQRKTGRAKAQGSGGGSSAGRKIFNRTLMRGKRK